MRSLDSNAQQALIAQAVANIAERRRRLEGQPSPDGRYKAVRATITDNAGHLAVQASASLPEACDPGWKDDSSGCYFLDVTSRSAGDGMPRFLAMPTPTP